RVRVEHLGGMIGNVGMGTSDMPRIEPGEEVILFLTSALSRKSSRFGFVYRLVGAAQGKYSVGADGIARKGGFAILRRDRALVDPHIAIDTATLIETIRSCE
ncbi:hypothetical protein ACFL43_07505, partial [Thermodesulfobacteriota bacterium]